jgi:protein O-GlcNAc transferase
VDVESFARELPTRFADFPTSEQPSGRRFDHVLDAIRGLARENNLALLNLAASLLDQGESYVEVGAYKGASLVGAMLDNDGDFVAIDDFSFRDGGRAELEANLERFGLAGRATILEGDAFELLRGDALAGRRVGVYYYDAAHSYEAHMDGLRLVEPYLADEALLIVDDSDWEQVARALRDYLSSQPKARLLVEVGGKSRGLPHWWEGMQVLAWKA